MIEQLLAPFDPEESALTPLFQANFDEGMLREIAAADYGWKAGECYALLQPILKGGLVASDDFNLREVLELTRWSEPGGWEQIAQAPRKQTAASSDPSVPAHPDSSPDLARPECPHPRDASEALRLLGEVVAGI